MNQVLYAGKHLLTYSVARHSHASWEFIYCTGGRGVVHFDGMSFSYEEGDIVAVPPGAPHSNTSAEGFTNIHVNIQHPSFSVKQPTIFHDDGNRLIRSAFLGTFLQFSADRGQQTHLLAAYGNLLVCHLSAQLETPVYSMVVEEITSKIISSYPECDFALDDYLRSLPFSYDYLRKLFKKEVGVTPHHFLSDLRLQVSAQYLASNRPESRNVSEIARLCGFREPLYFSRMFKKKYGMSPTAYSRAAQHPKNIPGSDSMKIML